MSEIGELLTQIERSPLKGSRCHQELEQLRQREHFSQAIALCVVAGYEEWLAEFGTHVDTTLALAGEEVSVK